MNLLFICALACNPRDDCAVMTMSGSGESNDCTAALSHETVKTQDGLLLIRELFGSLSAEANVHYSRRHNLTHSQGLS